MGLAILIVLAILYWSAILLEIYGIYLCFIKKWYLGAVALFVPGFALVIGAAKLFFKKDLLA